MHLGNQLFWQYCKNKYPAYFSVPSHVIEFGSLNINGSIRDYFNCASYIGVDWRPGKNVDFVSLAHEVPFGDASFDTVVSASMLEHDPFWGKSLAKMVGVLKPSGLFAISWGAARNRPHELKTAPDGQFHALKAALVSKALNDLGLYVHEFLYERSLLIAKKIDVNDKMGWGEVALIGFKDKTLAIDTQSIAELLPEDRS